MKRSIGVYKGTKIVVKRNMELKLYCRFLAILILSLSSMAQADVSTTLNVEGLSFISPDYENTQDKSFSFVAASIRSKKTATQEISVFNIDLEAKYAVGKPILSYTNAREIYFFQESESVNISYGRRLHTWSQLDQTWELGFFQPQFRWNPLDPSAQGLVGIFLDNHELNTTLSSEQNLRWTLFGSPLFVPDQGPGYELKQGQFAASNPWFNPPPQNVEFAGQIVPIDYNVHVPETNEVLFQSTYGAQIVYQFDSGIYVQTSFISKPSHQLALTYKAVLVADRVKADVIPKMYREQNLAIDAGYKQDWGSVGLMFLSNSPDPIVADLNYNYPEIKPSLSWGPQAKLNLEHFNFFASALMVSGGEVLDRGPDAGQVTTSLTSKYQLRTAYQLGANFRNRLNRVTTYQSEVNWTEGLNSALKILKIRNQFNFYRSIGIYVDVLFVETADRAETTATSNVTHLQNLDQILLGANYEF
jgi:hypothetical protein